SPSPGKITTLGGSAGSILFTRCPSRPPSGRGQQISRQRTLTGGLIVLSPQTTSPAPDDILSRGQRPQPPTTSAAGDRRCALRSGGKREPGAGNAGRVHDRAGTSRQLVRPSCGRIHARRDRP